MKTIGYVLSDFPVLSETFIGNEMRAVERLGHRVQPLVLRMAASEGQPDDRELVERAIRLPLVPASAGAQTFVLSLGRARRWLPFLLTQRDLPRRSLTWAAARVAAMAGRAGCGHLHAHFAQASAATAIVAARMLGVPVSFTGHGYDVYAAPTDLAAKLAEADFAVAVCRDMADDFLRLAPAARVATVPCGIDPARFRPIPRAADTGELRVLFIGRLVDSKGVDDLLHAVGMARAAAPLRLTIVGDGPLRGDLEALARSLGLEGIVTFAGARPSAWIAAEAPAFDVLVAPFRQGANGTRDTGPVVVKEAMAMGLPVIASRFMGLKEIVADDCGFPVPVGDAVAVADALVRLEGMGPGRRQTMGEAGRRRVLELYTVEAQARALSALIEGA